MGKLPTIMNTPVPESPLTGAIRRILAPVARLMIARGVRYQDVADRLKEAYLASAMRHFTPAGKRLTDSRLSVLTGLQRKDIKAIRARMAESADAPFLAGPLPRLIAHWRTLPEFRDADGQPAILARSGGTGPSFESLAATVSTDIHPRSVLDELVRLGLVEETGDGIALTAEAYIPGRDEAAVMGYLGANLGDHLLAATENVLSEGSPPHFERAVHYNRLSPDALAELEALARQLQQEVLERLAARAMELQDRAGEDPSATGRFRCGAYTLSIQNDQPEPHP